jgi:hypothetical protein
MFTFHARYLFANKCNLCIRIANFVSLIKDDIMPINTKKEVLLHYNSAVSCNQDTARAHNTFDQLSLNNEMPVEITYRFDQCLVHLQHVIK